MEAQMKVSSAKQFRMQFIVIFNIIILFIDLLTNALRTFTSRTHANKEKKDNL